MPLLGLSIPLQPEAPGLAWLPTPTGKRCWCSSRGRWAPRGAPYTQVNSGTWILSPIRVSRAFTGHISNIQVVGTFFFWKPVLCLKAFLGAGCGSCSWSRWICILQLLFFFFLIIFIKKNVFMELLVAYIHFLRLVLVGFFFLKQNLMPVFNCHVLLLR